MRDPCYSGSYSARKEEKPAGAGLAWAPRQQEQQQTQQQHQQHQQEQQQQQQQQQTQPPFTAFKKKPLGYMGGNIASSLKKTKWDAHSAATAIQASWRGHRVRCARPLEALRELRSIEAKALNLSRQIATAEWEGHVAPLERLRLSEGVMALLLAMDGLSCPPAVPAVRQRRKDLARQLTALQDKADSLGTPGLAHDTSARMREGCELGLGPALASQASCQPLTARTRTTASEAGPVAGVTQASRTQEDESSEFSGMPDDVIPKMPHAQDVVHQRLARRVQSKQSRKGWLPRMFRWLAPQKTIQKGR